MAQGDNSPGMSRLAGVLNNMVAKGQSGNPVFDFGTIQKDGSLLTNRFPIAIPKTDYLVLRCAGLPNSEVVRTSGHSHSISVSVYSGGDPSHSHGAGGSATSGTDTVNIARSSQAHIKAGDRVLVAWVDNDAVVLDKIVSASDVL
ncbi:MAG: hypothetical protein IJ649_08270 [Oscillospiraceae bacterium]|nr:hypothetical protein [Oscillospiraceae bacterium]